MNVILLLALIPNTIFVAESIVDTAYETSENFIRIRIHNKHPLKLSTVHSMDMARWQVLANTGLVDLRTLEPSYTVTQRAMFSPATCSFCALGTPPQTVEVIFDAGASILWAPPQFYNPEMPYSHKALNETFATWYGSIKTNGTFDNDRLTGHTGQHVLGGLNFDSVMCGDTDLRGGQSVNGIVDTGATLIIMGHILFKNLAESIPNATVHGNMIEFPPSSV
ncbi:hypothetical protein BGZ74_002531 [Mortierella antarctica]|nr:hypothetical protein BGZ74_002531 [Mortierella antarctica]